MRMLPRLLARSACAAAALCCALPASADTPRDYAMPYVLDTAANGVTFKGITLVDSANFGQSNRLVAKAANVGAPSIVVAGDIDDTGLHNVRPHTLVWAQENRWKRAPLRQGLEPTPETVSSEPAANTACDHEVIYRDFSAPTQAVVFYRLPGENTSCGNADDEIRWINVSDGPGADPTTMTGFNKLNLHPIYRSDGQLHAIYTLQAGAILRIASDLANVQTVRSSVNKFEVVGSLPDGAVVALIDGNLERIRPAGTIAASPLRVPRAGYRIAQAFLHQGEVFYLERAQDAGEAVQTRIGRVDAGGAAAAVAMLNLKLPTTLEGFTTNKVLYTVKNAEADTATLFAYPKDGTLGSATQQKIYRAEAENITVFTTHGNNVFFNVNAVVLFPELVFNSAAYVYSDQGNQVKFYGAGSAFLGGQITDSGPGALEQVETFDRLLLGTKGRVDTPLIASAKLFSLDPAALTPAFLVDLQRRMQPLYGFGFGPGSIGGLLNLEDNETDVFAFDLINVRYRLLTDTTPGSEFPTF